MACVKHYAMYGAAEAGRDYNTTDMSRVTMYNAYLPPYKAAVDAGAGSFMASFNEVDGIPATGNKWLLTDVLRKQWGFKGFVVTDYTGINEMTAHGMGNLQQVSALALNAGVDMDMVGEGFLTTLKKSLARSLSSIARLRQQNWELESATSRCGRSRSCSQSSSTRPSSSWSGRWNAGTSTRCSSSTSSATSDSATDC